jgi:hypothetical protein
MAMLPSPVVVYVTPHSLCDDVVALFVVVCDTRYQTHLRNHQMRGQKRTSDTHSLRQFKLLLTLCFMLSLTLLFLLQCPIAINLHTPAYDEQCFRSNKPKSSARTATDCC